MLWQRRVKSSLRSDSRGRFARPNSFAAWFTPHGAVKRKISGPVEATKPLIFLGKNVFFLLARQA